MHVGRRRQQVGHGQERKNDDSLTMRQEGVFTIYMYWERSRRVERDRGKELPESRNQGTRRKSAERNEEEAEGAKYSSHSGRKRGIWPWVGVSDEEEYWVNGMAGREQSKGRIKGQGIRRYWRLGKAAEETTACKSQHTVNSEQGLMDVYDGNDQSGRLQRCNDKQAALNREQEEWEEDKARLMGTATLPTSQTLTSCFFALAFLFATATTLD
ncbi:hypothetical protein C8R45DRAFT_923139 [Mycena sanguinolenta]|nr:hypothetical protein C8R45DRAFT_923139 [Mycena sanguinolenta]